MIKIFIYSILGGLFIFAAAQPIAMSIHTGLQLDCLKKPKYPKPQKPPPNPKPDKPIPQPDGESI
jgi:hypothetical protein